MGPPSIHRYGEVRSEGKMLSPIWRSKLEALPEGEDAETARSAGRKHLYLDVYWLHINACPVVTGYSSVSMILTYPYPNPSFSQNGHR